MRAYFLGAGASKQDGFPLTRELKHGVAWAICRDPGRFRDLAAHLRHLHNVDDAALRQNAKAWEALRSRSPSRISPEPDQTVAAGQQDSGAPVSLLPDVTDWLSTLDWMMREQSSFGPGRDTSSPSKLSLLAQLTQVRDLVVQALCVSLGLHESELPPGSASAPTTRSFMELVQPDDLLITTNWDLLLDAARDERFGTCQEDYGTGGSNVILENVRPNPEPTRPRLLKLHGSLSWRYCPRCQRLVIDPRNHVAGDRSESPNCKCSYPFSELIVTPGFVREYRNVHLLTIWREALLALATADEWVFIGYSLPPDDVGIRALLLRARCIREDVEQEGPRRLPLVTVVSGCDRERVGARYRSIVPQPTLYPGSFRQYVTEANAIASA
jgi:hypothetical protein